MSISSEAYTDINHKEQEDQETKLEDSPLGDQFVPVLGLESKVAVTDRHHQRASQHGRYRDVVQGPTDEPHGTHDKPTKKENSEEVQADYRDHAEGGELSVFTFEHALTVQSRFAQENGGSVHTLPRSLEYRGKKGSAGRSLANKSIR